MSEGPKMPYVRAVNLANRFMALIEPHVAKQEVAGSIRRGCREIGDIEIVCVENPLHPLGTLFHKDYPGLVLSGPRLKRFKYPASGVQIELYVTSTWDYGRILAIRTGSAWYSHCQLATNWNRLGWCGTEDGLRRKKECVKKGNVWKILPEFAENPTKPPVFNTEADFFGFLGIPWVAPQQRNWSDPTPDGRYNYSK